MLNCLVNLLIYYVNLPNVFINLESIIERIQHAYKGKLRIVIENKHKDLHNQFSKNLKILKFCFKKILKKY